ncbi:MAG: hypothetical protein E3J92_03465 [Dehalococcoidia bacterium]|nr:MAG: hypothetical protein E3J92_03465 [Dehalococcoidia bacterium]
MPYKEGQLTFIDFLGYKPVMALAKKRLFGKPYLTFNACCAVLASVYESAAVLGRVRCEKLGILEKILEAQTPRLRPELMKSLQERAKERLDAFRNEAGREPHSFLEFIQVKQLEKAIPDEKLKRLWSAIYNTRRAGGRETDKVRELRQLSFKSKKIMKKLEMKVSLAGAEISIRMFGEEGIGFGSSFPQLTERMYRNLHENIDMLGLSEAGAHGLAIPDKLIISLEEQEEEILQIVSVYTLRYWPEMLDPLDLRGHLEMVKEEDR